MGHCGHVAWDSVKAYGPRHQTVPLWEINTLDVDDKSPFKNYEGECS